MCVYVYVFISQFPSILTSPKRCPPIHVVLGRVVHLHIHHSFQVVSRIHGQDLLRPWVSWENLDSELNGNMNIMQLDTVYVRNMLKYVK